MLHEIKEKFIELYHREPVVFRSPGRVNLIGEHTDYNEGFVLPAAINKEILFAVAFNNLRTGRIFSFDLKESVELNLTAIQPGHLSWANYLLGVIDQFQKAGLFIKGFDLVFGGNIPIGAGLSSSAAVECGLAFALNHLHGFNLNKLELVKMAQKAEHEYAGVLCGIMDQFASMFGKMHHAIKLDCRSLEYEYYPLNMQDSLLVLCDSQVKHSLAASEYNTRRQECEAGVAVLQKHYPEVTSLRQVTRSMLDNHKSEMSTVVYRRCTYVVSENNRVEEGCAALRQGAVAEFGKLMYDSHQGLQFDYEVSCPELDSLVEEAKTLEIVLGARMMGGGFGGCTINLVEKAGVPDFIEQMQQVYWKQYGIELKTYVAELADGTNLIS